MLETNDRLKESLHDNDNINNDEEIINHFGVVGDNHAPLGSISPQLSNLTMKAFLQNPLKFQSNLNLSS